MAEEKSQHDLETIFRQVSILAGHGPRCDLALLPAYGGLRGMLVQQWERLDRWIREVRAQHAPTMYPVFVGYVESLRMNAFAFVRENYGFVGLYPGSVLTIYSFFSNLLAHPNFFPTIGDPQKEEQWAGFDRAHIVRIPKDPTRGSFAGLLSVLAIDFLFTHEIGHLMNGHAELINVKLGVPVFAEFDVGQSKALDNLTSQTLEMDADCFATGQGVSVAVGRASNPEAVFPEHWRQWYKTPRSALAMWSLAVYGLHRMFLGGQVPPADHLDSTHPDPSVRLLVAYLTAVELLKKRGLNELASELDSIFAEAVHPIEHGHAFLTSTQVNASGARAAFDPPARKHLNVLLGHWKSLRPELLPFVHGGKLAE
jgi:hypothetical protein